MIVSSTAKIRKKNGSVGRGVENGLRIFFFGLLINCVAVVYEGINFVGDETFAEEVNIFLLIRIFFVTLHLSNIPIV